MRFASSAVRPSGFVHSTALPARAVSLMASSCMKFGTPTTTTSVSGCSIAAWRSVTAAGMPQRSRNASPRASLRE